MPSHIAKPSDIIYRPVLRITILASFCSQCVPNERTFPINQSKETRGINWSETAHHFSALSHARNARSCNKSAEEEKEAKQNYSRTERERAAVEGVSAAGSLGGGGESFEPRPEPGPSPLPGCGASRRGLRKQRPGSHFNYRRRTNRSAERVCGRRQRASGHNGVPGGLSRRGRARPPAEVKYERPLLMPGSPVTAATAANDEFPGSRPLLAYATAAQQIARVPRCVHLATRERPRRAPRSRPRPIDRSRRVCAPLPREGLRRAPRHGATATDDDLGRR